MILRVLKSVDRGIAGLEAGIALASVTAILLLVSWQVPLRLMSVERRKEIAASLGAVGDALFDDYTWMTPLARFLLLWATLAGASLATRARRHIVIDVVVRAIPKKRIQAGIGVPSALVAAALTGFLCWIGVGFVHENWHDQSTLRGLNLGPIQVILPFAFGVMTFRFLIAALEDARGVWSGDLAYLAQYEAHPELAAKHILESGERAGAGTGTSASATSGPDSAEPEVKP